MRAGATGFVGSELCKQLLARGFHVRGTVRSLGARSDALRSALLKASGANADLLELVAADLLVPGAFDRAVEGAEYLFHVASPFAIVVDDPQKQLVDLAVQGTTNVLSSAAKHKATLKRVVLTSSMAGEEGRS